MHTAIRFLLLAALLFGMGACQGDSAASREASTDDGWVQLGLADFENVNGAADTWSQVDGRIVCTGVPLGGARTLREYTNFELELEWMHHEHGGNSGVFLWCPESAFSDLPPGQLPRSGIEVQVLDLGYEENWKRSKGSHSDWFTSHGDVFPVGKSTMKPFPPVAPKSQRSFPRKHLSRGVGEWNHYYIRALNGEVRLWVNGEEVNGGSKCVPGTGYLALEAEGALVEFRNVRLRELP